MERDGQADWCEGLLGWADSHRRGIFGVVVLLYLLGCNGQWRIEPDTGLYLTLGRNVATGLGYTYHGRVHALVYPGLPYLFAGVYRAFPGWHARAGDLVIENLLMPAMGVATLGVIYWMLKLAARRPVAVIATVSLALSRTYYRTSFSLLTDLPFLLGVAMFLGRHQAILKREGSAWMRWGLLWAGFAIALVMRPTWLVFLPIMLLAIAQAVYLRAMGWRAAGVALLVGAATVAVFHALDPRRAAPADVARYETAVFSSSHVGDLGAVLPGARVNIRDILMQYTTSAVLGIKLGPSPDTTGSRHWYDYAAGGLGVAISLAILAAGIVLIRRQPVWVVWIAATLGMMVMFLPLERYYLQAGPVIFLACWEGIIWLRRRVGTAWGNVVFAAGAALLVIPNLVQVGAMIVEQRRTPFFEHYRGGKFAAVLEAGKAIEALPEDAIVLSPTKTERILTYLSGRTVEEGKESGDDPGKPHYVLELPEGGGFELSAWSESENADGCHPSAS